jgi:hypothetical protein
VIGDGLFQAQLNTIEQILESMEMLEERQLSPNKSLGASHFRGMTYRQVYEESVREYAYDFRLSDQSLLLFIKGGSNCHDGALSYNYLECPVRVMAYREFVGNMNGVTVMDEDFDEVVDEWGDELRPDYEQYVNSLDSKHVVTPLRYDYKASDYRPGIHPASHVHFGHENEIRVGTHRVMKPLSFLLFVLRQRYPAAWERLRGTKDMPVHVRNVRNDLDVVDAAYWADLDLHEIYLH